MRNEYHIHPDRMAAISGMDVDRKSMSVYNSIVIFVKSSRGIGSEQISALAGVVAVPCTHNPL